MALALIIMGANTTPPVRSHGQDQIRHLQPEPGPGAKVVESFDDDLSFFELAERLGYDKVWIAEHLFSSYGLVTSTQVYAAAIAQRTSKVRIGMAVCAIPFNHPLRTASDFALVDILSHGRLDFGVGRAYQPHEFVGLGVPMDKSREMLAEGLDIVLKSW